MVQMHHKFVWWSTGKGAGSHKKHGTVIMVQEQHSAAQRFQACRHHSPLDQAVFLQALALVGLVAVAPVACLKHLPPTGIWPRSTVRRL